MKKRLLITLAILSIPMAVFCLKPTQAITLNSGFSFESEIQPYVGGGYDPDTPNSMMSGNDRHLPSRPSEGKNPVQIIEPLPTTLDDLSNIDEPVRTAFEQAVTDILQHLNLNEANGRIAEWLNSMISLLECSEEPWEVSTENTTLRMKLKEGNYKDYSIEKTTYSAIIRIPTGTSYSYAQAKFTIVRNLDENNRLEWVSLNLGMVTDERYFTRLSLALAYPEYDLSELNAPDDAALLTEYSSWEPQVKQRGYPCFYTGYIFTREWFSPGSPYPISTEEDQTKEVYMASETTYPWY